MSFQLFGRPRTTYAKEEEEEKAERGGGEVIHLNNTLLSFSFLSLSQSRQREEEEEEDDEEDYWSLSAVISQCQEQREKEDAALGLTPSVAMATSRSQRTVIPSSYFSDGDDSD